jgi:molybdopterin synthase sulfur carrier subunit
MGNAVNVLFFASLRDDVGMAGLQLSASDTTELIAALANELSAEAMAALTQDDVRLAVNQQLIEGVTRLEVGDEVAFLPPVTGG